MRPGAQLSSFTGKQTLNIWPVVEFPKAAKSPPKLIIPYTDIYKNFYEHGQAMPHIIQYNNVIQGGLEAWEGQLLQG